MTTEENTSKQFCQDLTTIKDVLRWSVTEFEKHELFFGHGTDNAWDEAVTLLLFFLKVPSDKLSLLIDAKLTLTEKQELYKLLEKRIKQRVPLPYITNQAWFADMEFYVDENVLIPRSPLAEFISNDLQPWLNIKPDLNVLEIGTGSGCIACAMAEHFLEQDINISIDATDVSDKALAIAGKNIADYELEEHINLIKSDLFSSLDNKKYDLIVSNPPYVDADEMRALPAEFLHEPQSALAAGEDGLELVDKMLSTAYNYLNDDGILVVEVGASQEALEAKYPETAFTWIDFEFGGDGVFVLTKDELKNFCK